MTVDSLASSLAQLRLNADRTDTTLLDARIAEEEAGTTESFRPRKRARQNVEDLKSELERDFLTPSPRFSPDWLNRLQRLVLKVPPSALFQKAFSNHILICFYFAMYSSGGQPICPSLEEICPVHFIGSIGIP
jgi:hypothetical protein